MHGASTRRFSDLRRHVVSEQPPRVLLAVRPATAIAVGTVFAVALAWATAATWFIFSNDDVTAQLLRRQAGIQAAYEEKVGALRARLDRVASQKLLEQDSLEDRVSQLVSRQVELETRQAMLFNLGNHIDMADLVMPPPAQPATPVIAGSVVPEQDALAPAISRPRSQTGSTTAPPASASAFTPVERKPAPEAMQRPEPETEPFRLRLRGDREEGSAASDKRAGMDMNSLSLIAQLGAIDFSLGHVEADQFMRLDRINSGVADDASRLREAIIQTGLDPDRLDPLETGEGSDTGLGGPYIPSGLETDAGPFETMVGMLQENLVELDRLRRTTAALPFARPVSDRIGMSSGFGVRADPFTRRPAMHSGIDFRARRGTPILATGAGRVTTAEYHGGYGNMVEIDHGNEITTRFAHLSSISVVPGEFVTAGTMLGRAGSTGRSTGPHLHYETRLGDKPVDPRRFLRAAALLAETEADEEEAED
ncbi:MAG TPA: peptidoglycan DD-metalloendopeptidase family protein [Saliniramus sp.]|nr:peptidoglycan DD-metalloendopeptidase family protein [Saliniramus sp.]